MILILPATLVTKRSPQNVNLKTIANTTKNAEFLNTKMIVRLRLFLLTDPLSVKIVDIVILENAN